MRNSIRISADVRRYLQTCRPACITTNAEIKLAAYIDKHDELTQKINEETDKLFETKKEIRLKIYQIKNPKYRLVLMKWYIRFKKWEQIQEELGYKELKSVYNVHNKALSEFIRIHGNIF